MPRSRVFLIDFSSGSQLASEAEDLLRACSSAPVDLQVVSARVNASDCDEKSLETLVSQARADLCLLIVPSAKDEIRSLVSLVKRITAERPVAVVVENCEALGLLRLLRTGAADFMIPPLRALDVVPRVLRLLDQTKPREALVATLKEKLGIRRLIGESPAFLQEIRKIPQISRCNVSVLIQGETGTGKEMCARAIHYLGPQASRPFVPVNCGAIPIELIENELFGHRGGAFTGAKTTQPGLIEEADQGTLFLDEVGCLPLLAQVKLLRFLQDGEYRPLGSAKLRRATVRIISATNLDLEQAVNENQMRRDLYYRLNIVQITLPPLRERAEDVPILARYFLAKYAREFNKGVTDFDPEAIQRLVSHDWPGNVRELEHVVQRAAVLSQGTVIGASDLLLRPLQSNSRIESLREAKARIVGNFESTYIKSLLLTYKGNITRAAQAAGKNRRAFWQLIRKYRIDVESLKLTPRHH
jgi:two-component system, NtrC family, response regulator GlrR